MNDQHDGSELPELSDDDVRLLYAICQRASSSPDPPFKALFGAYDAILREEELEQEHDGVIFRALLRVGESTAEANRKRQHVDLIERLEDVLEARGITLIKEDGEEEYTGTQSLRQRPKRLGRRVSFDDARLEETWLSEHSKAVNPQPPSVYPPDALLSLPPRRARHANTGRRARSTSSQRGVVRHPAPKSFQTSSSQDHISDDGDPQNPTLHFEVSQTQLEINADAMLAVSEVRLQRRTLHSLHDQTLQLQAAHKQSNAIAAAYDHRILLKQALETWHGALLEQRYERRHEQHFQHLERKAERARDLFLITKAFTHWATQCSDERFRTRIAQHYVLRAKYFKRWRAIAIENQSKIRRILCRKYVAIWREKTARRSLSDEYATAWYEERLMRRCKLSMFWEFCSRQVTDNRDVWIKRGALSRLRRVLNDRQEASRQAQHLMESRATSRALHTFNRTANRRQHDITSAAQLHDRVVSFKAVNSLSIHARLAPLARDLTLKIELDLKRKAFQIWYRNAVLESQAANARRKMLLLNAITKFNDDTRCKKLGRMINVRLFRESIYRITLYDRLQTHLRESDFKLQHRAFNTWRARVTQERNQIEYAQAVFAESQNRRHLRFGMFALHVAKRQHEDAERAAIEFRNSRDLPQVFDAMRQQNAHLQRLESWAQMAVFYRLATRTLRVWNERTTEHKANRRRDAYARVRGRIKFRVVGTCFAMWRRQAVDIRSMDGEAARRAEGRTVAAKADALGKWREKTAIIARLEVRATEIDEGRLLRSALSVLLAQSAEKAALQQRLEQSNRATDLALLASAMRRLLWESFRAARNHESAEALRLRNRDTHAKQMLRHWAAQTVARRLPPPPADARGTPAGERRDDEPESPSLRPASRAASRASASNAPAGFPPSSPPHQPSGFPGSTPAYMRTPSRSTRRAGRFRPLPTPAAGTPFAFDRGYLATTPAPLPSAGAPPPDAGMGMEGLTPQVTPFERKLRAGGFGAGAGMPPSALRGSVLGGAATAGGPGGPGGGTGKSVRFAGSGGRFGRLKSS